MGDGDRLAHCMHGLVRFWKMKFHFEELGVSIGVVVEFLTNESHSSTALRETRRDRSIMEHSYHLEASKDLHALTRFPNFETN